MNADDRFLHELDAEMDEVVEAYGRFKVDIAVQALKRAEDLTPVRTGQMRESWGASYGPKPDLAVTGGSATARASLAGMDPFDPVWLHNNDFRSGFFEGGTPRLSPRHMLRRGVRSVSRKKLVV